ncbi:hypothetical protein I41_28650 [Lacipirellula limnantheis]|uniref:Uncharacterized protein n=1 Tax=Lacipirellula limnantheis TaxID=2528024 RepID=A0A517TZ87_9BACT|nr:hypothetical protein I41_28650 [Lacipirellula limnantheis]
MSRGEGQVGRTPIVADEFNGEDVAIAITSARFLAWPQVDRSTPWRPGHTDFAIGGTPRRRAAFPVDLINSQCATIQVESCRVADSERAA